MYFDIEIHNPNKFIITRSNYYIVPIGTRCPSAIACKLANIRKFSLPFDWVFSDPSKIQKVLENNFEDFLPKAFDFFYRNKYDILFPKFGIDFDIGKDGYIRRANRLNKILNSNKKIYFIFTNEDYLYDPKYREKNFDSKMFEGLLNLELFLINKYKNINFNILCFDFIKRELPEYSKIINFIIKPTEFLDSFQEFRSNQHDFRIYCGVILSKIFKSKFNLNYNFEFEDYTNMFYQ
jgi:hypothetical protein